jgi:arabinofuranosyltransferase
MRRDRVQVLILTSLALLACVLGWRLFWFLCDDAYIAFRYAANRQAGFGYTWNPPPFLPVEGYTCFLWVLLLDAAWSMTGLAPPKTANTLSLLFSLGSLLLLSLATTGLWRRRPGALPVALPLGLALAWTVGNRSFLAWTSSGLEAAMFGFFLHAWLAAALALALGRDRWLLALATAAGLAALTRPEGYLWVGATGALAAGTLWPRRRDAREWLHSALRLMPLLLVPLHLLWRHTTYGAWLPNTAGAKIVSPWPEAGLRYLASFALEHALWLWVLPVGWALLRWGVGLRGRQAWIAAVVAALLLVHAVAYPLVVGGDNFGYRALTFTVPLLGLGLAWAPLQLGWRWPRALGVGLAVLAAGALLPWTHWALHRQHTDRIASFGQPVETAAALPGPFGPYAGAFDGLQAWLNRHGLCQRHQEHKLFTAHLEALLPRREEGARAFGGVDNPVVSALAVGMVGWVYPQAHILDEAGLNDWVVARSPYRWTQERFFAHERTPPPDYAEALAPVARFTETGLQPLERARPLSDQDIRDIEARFRAKYGDGS